MRLHCPQDKLANDPTDANGRDNSTPAGQFVVPGVISVIG